MSLNRTIVELKPRNYWRLAQFGGFKSYHSGIETSLAARLKTAAQSLNRTIVELKRLNATTGRSSLGFFKSYHSGIETSSIDLMRF